MERGAPVRAGDSAGCLSPAEFASAVGAITSAFGDPTRRAVYLFVHERSSAADTGITAAEVAERFELHPNVARHHLDKLAGGGHLEVSTGPARNGAGRPSKRYRVSAPGIALELPVRHDDLLITLLGKALAKLPAEVAEATAEEVGIEYGRALAAAMGGVGGPGGSRASHRSFRTALRAVADALSAHGFAAHAESRDGELRIVSDHCPFGDAAIEHPVFCAVDRGLVKGMLGSLYGEAGIETTVSLPRGGDHCETAVRA